MSESGNDLDRCDVVQRPHGGTNRQSRYAIIISLAVHLLLLVVLYQQRLAYLAESARLRDLLADMPQEQETSQAGYRLEMDASSPDRAPVQEALVNDQPAPTSSDLRRHLDAPMPSTPRLTDFHRRDLAGASQPAAATIAAVPPVVATESAGPTASMPEPLSPALVLARDRVPLRAADSLPSLSLSPSRAQSRRRVEAAQLPVTSWVAEHPVLEPPTFATSSPDAIATRTDRAADPAESRLARTESKAVARVLTIGSMNRPRRSRDPIPAAPIVAQLAGPVRIPAPAYAHRGHRQLPLNETVRGRTSAETDAAIELGLQYLARIQLESGQWEFQYLGDDADPEEIERIIIHADAAATGLALLAFLGAGHDHFGSRYEHHVQAGLDYLKSVQSSNGEMLPEQDPSNGQVARFYGHGIATLALCEAYGMTGDPALRQPAQSAIDFLVATQHPQYGGWRYVPGTNTDLSVSGWQLLALKSGAMAGLSVRDGTFQRIRALVEQCREQDGLGARFCYNPWASPSDPLTRHGRSPSTVMTAVGTLMQLHLDGNASDKRLRQNADHLLANLPQLGDTTATAPISTLGNPQRDTYYWYYATQVMYQLGGEHWKAWNAQLHPLLVTSQTTGGPLAGSWDPWQPVPDKWANYGGRLYLTAMNLLSLEVDSRHLPLAVPDSPRIADRPE